MSTENAREIFLRMGPLVGPVIEEEFDRRDLCILTARVAMDVAAYYGIQAKPLAVRVLLYNATFARHAANEFNRSNVASWNDDSWSVGVGYGTPPKLDSRVGTAI